MKLLKQKAAIMNAESAMKAVEDDANVNGLCEWQCNYRG